MIELKYHLYDLDNNLLNLPSKIILLKDGKLVSLTTAEFALIRHDNSYSPPQGDWELAFNLFRDDGNFSPLIDDFKYAVDNRDVAPAFESFRECLISGSLFGIITARGHSSKNIRTCIEYFISECLNDNEKEQMLNNLEIFNIKFNKGLIREELLNNYLDANEYIGISEPTFLSTVKGIDGGVRAPETLKGIAIKRFVERIVKHSNKLNEEFVLKIGYSDDDLSTVSAIETMFQSELSKQYPHIKFVVFNTSDPNMNNGQKTIIKA